MYRRLDEWHLSRDAYYSTISDSDLDDLVREIKIRQNPNIGEVMLMAALKVRKGSAYQIAGKYSSCRPAHNRATQKRYNSKESVATQWMAQTAYGT